MKLREHQYAVVLHHLNDELVYTHDPAHADRLRTADRLAMTEEQEVAHRDTCKHPADIVEANGTIISSTPRPQCCERVEAPNPTTYDLGETWTCRSCRKSWYVAYHFPTIAHGRVPGWREVGSLSFLVMLKYVSDRQKRRYKL